MSSSSTNAILDAVEQLLDEVGPDFTMAQLEDLVGVSRATVYRRVGTRAALLAALERERDVAVDDTRARLLRAARDVVGRDGFVGSTVERIAEEADVGIATVYRHFDGKDALLRATMRSMTPRPLVEAVLDQAGDDLDEALRALVLTLLETVRDERDVLRILLFGDDADQRYLAELRHRSGSTFGSVVSFLEGHRAAARLPASTDPPELALALYGLVVAFAMVGPMRLGMPLTDAAATAETITSLLLGRREDPT